MDAGLKPALLTPVGNPDSLPTLSVTGPVKLLTGVTVTVKAAAPPGTTCCPAGPTMMEKSGLVGVTVILRVGGLGSELPLESISVSEAMYSPAVAKMTLPGFWAVEVACEPPGKTHEYFVAVALVPKETAAPAGMMISAGGEDMLPAGGTVEYGVSWMKRAFEGIPALSSRNSM